MVQLSSLLVGLVALSVHVDASPFLVKRIAQTIAASTAKWEQACVAAGGGQQCNPLSIKAFSTLLANAGPCEQQNAADEMVDLANQLNSDEMVRLSQIFAQQPRNTPNSVATPYCQQAPKNSELNGLFQCQFVGANQQTFAGGATLGAAGTIPFGLKAPLNPLGSCPSHPDGPVPDGQQLVDIVGDAAPPSAPAPEPTGGPRSTRAASSTAAASATVATTASTVAAPTATASPGGFKLANGVTAQKLNAKFVNLKANSACTDGEVACVGTSFAQCVGGKFTLANCASTLTCAALPLVNSPGVSITCTTPADALARIAATGATGGLTGNGASAPASEDDEAGSGSSSPAPASSSRAPSPASTSTSSSSGGFQLQNGKDAQKLNAEFSSLSAGSTCAAGTNACVDGSFAQCVNGKFALTACGGGLTCAALPLVNKAGTTITCTTNADALARIAATGATGGLTGNGASAPAPGNDEAGSGSSSPVLSSSRRAPAPAPTRTPSTGPASSGFQLQNGKDAQKLNAEFSTLSAGSACTAGTNACVDGSFAQCVNGKFALTSCSGGLACAALPLVNKAGTTITCTTSADALARIAATGATGGLTGSGAAQRRQL